MTLYILRHADAQDHFNDQERPLSKKGIKQIENLCKFLSPKIFDGVQYIFHSPLVRAQETAELFKLNLSLKAPLKKIAGLEPWAEVEDIASFLAGQQEDLMIVGHNPHLEHLIAYLTSGHAMVAGPVMKKSSLACLEQIKPSSDEIPAGLWSIHWLLSPKLF